MIIEPEGALFPRRVSMKKRWMLAVVMTMLPGGAQAESDRLARYNVAWETPSQDSLDSMPLSGRLRSGRERVGAGRLDLALSGPQRRLRRAGPSAQARLRAHHAGRTSAWDGAGFRQELDLASGSDRRQARRFQGAAVVRRRNADDRVHTRQGRAPSMSLSAPGATSHATASGRT